MAVGKQRGRRASGGRQGGADRLELAMRAIGEGVYDWDVAANKIHYSEGVYTVLKMPRSMKTPAGWRARIHPDDLGAYDAAIRAHFKKKTRRFECEYRYRARDGIWRWARQRAIALRDGRGRAISMIGSIGDITELKRAEIELRRARDEATEALERQTATAEILKVIASSPTDIQPVFDAIVKSALRLLGGYSAVATRLDGQMEHLVAYTSTSKSGDEALKAGYPRPLSQSLVANAIRTRRPRAVSDFQTDPKVPPPSREVARARGYRSGLLVPMLREGRVIGTIRVTRREPGPFSDHEIGLLTTFADQAVIAIENVRLFNETREALAQLKASAEVLGAISGSITDTQPVFGKILESCERLFTGRLIGINLVGDDGKLHLSAYHGPGREELERVFPIPLAPDSGSAIAILERRVVHYVDAQNDPEVPDTTRRGCTVTGIRSVLFAPVLWEGRGIGAIFVGRDRVSAFSDKEIGLLETFAGQAAIAIQNARLFNETKEALERQTATAEILKVIAGSPSDVQPVFDAIAASARRLLGARAALVARRAGDMLHLAACTTTGDAGDAALRNLFPTAITGQGHIGRSILSAAPVSVSDVETDPAYSDAFRASARVRGLRSVLSVPMLREGEAIGVISVNRAEPGKFSEHQTNLLTTFADQAVIAIENVRLFNQTREALERQTATAEILKVISSSPTDVQPVFEAIVQSAARLFKCGAAIQMRDGDRLHLNAVADFHRNEEVIEKLRQLYPLPFDPEASRVSRAMQEGRILEVPDIEAQGVPRSIVAVGRAAGFRAATNAPLLRAGNVIGMLSLTFPDPGHKLDDKQREMLRTFADQAVIAIENVRLFNETKEALEQQTASAEILRVISSTPTDTQPVFDAIVESGVRLFEGSAVAVSLPDGDQVRLAAIAASDPAGAERWRAVYPFPLIRERMHGIAILDNRLIDVPDVEQSSGLPGEDGKRDFLSTGNKAITVIPMTRDDKAIGTISVIRRAAGRLSEKQLALLKTFADQAVIAIENVRLFNETKESLERQTATSAVLRVISGSPNDLAPVFAEILEHATRLCEAELGFVFTSDGQAFEPVAQRGLDAEKYDTWSAAFRQHRIPGPLSGLGRVLSTKAPVLIADVADDEAYRARDPLRVLTVEAIGARTFLAVPLLKESSVIGAVVIYRREVRPFSQKQVSLLQTFADQAVIAIENVRLFNETKEALERQTATAEILKVISESLEDTQPVFDAIVKSALRIFNGQGVGLLLVQGDRIALGSAGGAIDAQAARKRFPQPLNRDSASGQAILDRVAVNLADCQAPGMPEIARALGRALDYRAIIAMPLVRENAAIGALVVTRNLPGAFADKDVALLGTFADQAVIAIENVRLFKELQQRTEALSKSVGQLTALGDVGQAISSTLDLETVLKTIVQRAVQLTGLDGGSIYEYDERTEEYHLRAAENLSEEIVELLRRSPIRRNEGPVWRAGLTGQPTEVPEMLDESYQTPRREFLVRAGYRALLVVPLVRENHIVGALTVQRKSPGAFAPEIVELLKTFATQSALAIQNARLFREIAEKSHQLELASQHKSQFLSSMSHELRTPLNAILGFNEMLLGEVYGPLPGDMKEPMEDIQKSGRHLLRLINNVLDLAKIEAGRMELALADYSVQDTVESVRSTLRPLAEGKGLELLATVPQDLPLAHGDGGRITQCLMNLAGNSLKFTKAGKVEISVELKDGTLVYRVADTGVGIPPDKIGSLFTEFKQTDATIASEYGGTGLGLSITRKFIEMHGGRIRVESEPGKGSTFTFEVPLRAGERKAA